jgi:hypothetical protein
LSGRFRKRAGTETEEWELTNIITHLIGVAQGKHPVNAKRSDQWPKVRAEYLKNNPVCEVCGGNSNIEVHHIHPFHLHPELELNLTNLITLCESKKDGVNCHLWFGHLGNFRSFNTDVLPDSAEWALKIKNRPFQEAT